jgi:hypothetical protein
MADDVVAHELVAAVLTFLDCDTARGVTDQRTLAGKRRCVTSSTSASTTATRSSSTPVQCSPCSTAVCSDPRLAAPRTLVLRNCGETQPASQKGGVL